jgi:hypothetical protein
LLGATGAAGLLTAAGGYQMLGGEGAAGATQPPPPKYGNNHLGGVLFVKPEVDHVQGWRPEV